MEVLKEKRTHRKSVITENKEMGEWKCRLEYHVDDPVMILL